MKINGPLLSHDREGVVVTKVRLVRCRLHGDKQRLTNGFASGKNLELYISASKSPRHHNVELVQTDKSGHKSGIKYLSGHISELELHRCYNLASAASDAAGNLARCDLAEANPIKYQRFSWSRGCRRHIRNRAVADECSRGVMDGSSVLLVTDVE